MTVEELRDRLNELIQQGFGDDDARIFDPDTNEWQPITGLVYGGKKGSVDFYCDEP